MNGRRVMKRINRLTGGKFRNCMCDNNTAPFSTGSPFSLSSGENRREKPLKYVPEGSECYLGITPNMVQYRQC